MLGAQDDESEVEDTLICVLQLTNLERAVVRTSTLPNTQLCSGPASVGGPRQFDTDSVVWG